MLNHNLNYHATAAITDDATQTTSTAAKQKSQRRWLRSIFIIILALVTAAIVSILLVNLVWNGLPVGTSAPLFQGTTLNGQPIDLAQLRGKPVMLTFWSPDCFACREELPALQALAADPNADMQLVTVVSYMAAAEVEKFVMAERLTIPIIVNQAGSIAQQYEVSGIPFTYFIDQNGQIDQVVMGAGSEGELQNQLFTWLQSCQIDEVCSVE